MIFGDRSVGSFCRSAQTWVRLDFKGLSFLEKAGGLRLLGRSLRRILPEARASESSNRSGAHSPTPLGEGTKAGSAYGDGSFEVELVSSHRTSIAVILGEMISVGLPKLPVGTFMSDGRCSSLLQTARDPYKIREGFEDAPVFLPQPLLVTISWSYPC